MDAEALLPDGPYDLWQENDDERFVSELVRAFARNPSLPKFLKANVVGDTIAQGIDRGLFVGQLSRPDGSRRTWWREEPPRDVIEDDQLRSCVARKSGSWRSCPSGCLPRKATPCRALWDAEGVTLGDVVAYFGGGHTVIVPREGYDEMEIIPECGEDVLREAVRAAVAGGLLWLTNGPTSLWREPVPDDALTHTARLRARPERIPADALVEEALPGCVAGRLHQWRRSHPGPVSEPRRGSTLGSRAREHIGRRRQSLAAGQGRRWSGPGQRLSQRRQIGTGTACARLPPGIDAGVAILVGDRFGGPPDSGPCRARA